MKILHVADMSQFHINIESVIYRSVVEENKDPNTKSFLYSHLLKDSDIENYMIGKNKNIFKFMINFKPDLVLFHSLYKKDNIFLGLFCMLTNIKYAIRPHGSFAKTVYKKSSFKKNIANIIFFDHFIRNSSATLYLSREEKNSSYFNTSRNFFLPNMIDFTPREVNKKENKILYIGKIEKYYKNINFLIDVIEKSNTTNYVIEFIGPIDSSYYEEFIKKIEGSKISYLGELYGDEKQKKISEAKGLILLSISEGMPMVVLEALSNNVFCFLTQQCNMSYWIEKYNLGLSTDLVLKNAILKFEEFIRFIDNHSMESSTIELLKREFSWNTSLITQTYQSIIDGLE